MNKDELKERVMAYITKHALTSGIFTIEAEVCSSISSDMISDVNQSMACYHKGEWFKSKEEALANAEVRRARKIKSVEKQLENLKNMKFDNIANI